MHAIAIAPNNATASSAVHVAVDLAKDIFELAFADASGRIVERKRARATELDKAEYTNAAACSGAGRAGQQEGITAASSLVDGGVHTRIVRPQPFESCLVLDRRKVGQARWAKTIL